MSSKQTSPTDSRPPEAVAAHLPSVVRFGAAVTLAQCAAVFGYALYLVWENLRGPGGAGLESTSAATGYVGVGTAVFLVIVFGFVAYHAVRTMMGRPSGRGAIVLIEVILAGVAVYMFSGGAVLLGLVTLASVALALIGVFHPSAVAYWAARYEMRTRQW